MGRSLFVASRLSCSVPWFLPLAFAQNFGPPSSWQNTRSNSTRSQRQALAYEAAQNLQSHIDTSGELSLSSPDTSTPTTPTTKAGMAIVLSFQDLLSGNMTWKSPVTDLLSAQDTGLSYNVDYSYFGLAELSAYLAYNDSSRFVNAVRNWNTAYTDYITPAAAQINSFPRAINTTPECGQTLGGVVFDVQDTSSQVVSTYTISSWIALSSRLADLTQNTTYLEAAKNSIQFVQTHLLNPTNVTALINEAWSFSDCASRREPETWDLGAFIEGLSIVANVTQNQTYTNTLLGLIANAVVTTAWNSPEGIIKEQLPDYRKGIMLRGLLEAKWRNPSNTAMADLIDDYLTIQFNAVRNNALISGSDNNYGISWTDDSGTSSGSSYSLAGNVEALNVLICASAIATTDVTTVSPANNTTSVSPSSNTATGVPPNSSTTTAQHSSVGAIAGGVAGGVGGVITISLALFFCFRRRRRAREVPIREDKTERSTPAEAGLSPEPFVMAPSELDRPPLSKGGSGYSQAGHLNDLNGSTASIRMGTDSASGATTALNRARGVDVAQAVGSDDSVLSTLARRLDNLIDVLAIRGVVEDTPPEYDVSHPASQGSSRP